MIKASVFLVLAAALVQQQDEKAVHAKLNELRKQLENGSSNDKASALAELAGIYHDDARAMIAGQLGSPVEAVRLAAAKAIAKHRHPGSVTAIAGALGPTVKDEKMARAYIEALTELDMCACLPVLLTLLEVDNHDLAADALRAIAKIGCPEAVEGLVAFLKKAEDEAKEPDRIQLPGRKAMAPGKTGGGRGIQNAGKDQKLAKLVDPVRQALHILTGQSLTAYADWIAWLKNGGLSLKLFKIYLCEATHQVFEKAPGEGEKCPNSGGKKSHEDVFLKHKREGGGGGDLAPAVPKKKK